LFLVGSRREVDLRACTARTRYSEFMLDERLAFLRTVAAIGGWHRCSKSTRCASSRARQTVVPALVRDGLIEHDAAENVVRLTIEGLKRITPAAPQIHSARRRAARG
jgi:hypothetical protein